MSYFFLIIVFFFGLSVGSFLNVVIYRLYKGESIIFGRSHCPHCGHILNWHDLIPLFSFLFLKGRCRYCHQKISIQYPLVELATGLIFLFTATKFPFTNFLSFFTLSLLFVIFSFFIVIFVSDLKYYLISDKILYPSITMGFSYLVYYSFAILHSFNFFILSLLSSFLISFFFFALYFFSKEKVMGFGDFEIVLFLSFFLGFPKNLICFFLSFLLGGLTGGVLIISRKKSLKSKVPFAPFLISAAFVAFFWGKELLHWYLALLS